MKIEIIKTFLDGRNRFEPGEIRMVPDELGRHFCVNGWAKDIRGQVAASTPTAAPVELQIDDIHHGNNLEDAG